MKHTLIITVESEEEDWKIDRTLGDAELEVKDFIYYWLPTATVATKIVRSEIVRSDDV